MRTEITPFDEELLARSRIFLRAADTHPESRALLERFGFSDVERERGRELVVRTARSFAWVREGRAWRFLSSTPEGRVEEARHWYRDARRRHWRACVRAAEERSGLAAGAAAGRPLAWKLTLGLAAGVVAAARALSPTAWRADRARLALDLARARGPKPADAPPPKDSALVELAGWYERWRLLAQRVFRERADLLAPYGLTPGKAPPRLRDARAARAYGERAAAPS